MFRQLLDIVHHAIQLPLPIHLGFAALRKAMQSFIAAQVAEYRLHRCKAARDLVWEMKVAALVSGELLVFILFSPTYRWARDLVGWAERFL